MEEVRDLRGFFWGLAVPFWWCPRAGQRKDRLAPLANQKFGTDFGAKPAQEVRLLSFPSFPSLN